MAPPKVPLEARFERWTKRETGCWIWIGKIDWAGYGHMKHDGRDRKAATVSYEFHKGPIPKGLELDHLCHNKACVNPEHLEAITHSENLRRRRPFPRFKGGVCKNGHLLPPLSERNQNGACPTCYREYQAKWKAENADYEVDYRAANKDRINAQRRLRRSRSHKE